MVHFAAEKWRFIFSQFFWIRLLKISDKTAIKGSILAEDLTKNNPLPCSLIWLVAGFSSFCAVGARAWFCTGQWPESSLSSLPHGTLHSKLPSLRMRERDNRDREQKRMNTTGITIVYNLVLEAAPHPITFAMCMLFVRSKSLGQAPLKMVGLHKAWIPGGRDHCGPSCKGCLLLLLLSLSAWTKSAFTVRKFTICFFPWIHNSILIFSLNLVLI